MNKFFKKYNNKIKLLHRADKKTYLENSKEAIISGLQNENYDGIEIDIRLTKDNEWIIYHDNNLNRFCSINKIIKTINFNDLPILNYKNKKYNIIKLKDLIDLNFIDKIINIEIKEQFDLEKKIKDKLLEIIKLLKTDLLISSYHWEWYQWCNKNNLLFGHLIYDKEPKKYDLIILDYKKKRKINLKNNINKRIGYFNLNKIYKKYNLQILDN